MRVRLETRRSLVRTLPRSATFFFMEIDHEIHVFFAVILPSADSRRAERMCTILVNCLED